MAPLPPVLRKDYPKRINAGVPMVQLLLVLLAGRIMQSNA